MPREGDTLATSGGLASQIFAQLRFRDGSGRTLEKNILHESTLVGSAKGCDLRLKSESIAPVHCLISLDRWRLRIRDLSGNGGTKLNGQAIDCGVLSDGDKLSLGIHEFEVRTNMSGSEFTGFYLDRYLVTEVLGSGGMCWLYGARNSLTHEHVALKVLPSNFSPRTLAHFSLEARVGQRLGEHPHVVKMSRIIRADPVYCIVMEYLEGISLQELVDRDGPLAWRQACHFLRQAAFALDHVHSKNIVHRDLKPNNLIICRDGQLKLIDFNLALLLNEESPDRLLSHYRKQVVGTADYISPEQSRRSDLIDHRSDLYSLGCIFYFLLTGQVVYPTPSIPEKLNAQRAQPPRDVRELANDVPEHVAAVVARLLEKDPAQRFQSALEILNALDPITEPEPIDFDWGAVLTARAATARRRLEKLLAKQSVRRREAGQDSSVAVTDNTIDTPGGSSISPRPPFERPPVELDLFTALEEGSPRQQAEQQFLSELFLLWPQLSPEAQHQLVQQAQKLEQAAQQPTESPKT
jgi:serine/threonine-protein kinase